MSRTLTPTALSDADRALAAAARDTVANAYAPYSGFAVGAAVRTKTGKTYTGANLENASYGLSLCAEVAAIAAANSAGDFTIEAIAVTGRKAAAPYDGAGIVTPCGRCRQVIFEAAQRSEVDIRVLSCNADLSEIAEASISELLPAAFGPSNLA
jgi:cytidine deaminase